MPRVSSAAQLNISLRAERTVEHVCVRDLIVSTMLSKINGRPCATPDVGCETPGFLPPMR